MENEVPADWRKKILHARLQVGDVLLMGGDELMKYDPSTGKWSDYPMPTLGGETRYFSILERNGTMQITLPYARARKVAHMSFRTPQEIQALKNQAQQQERAQAGM